MNLLTKRIDKHYAREWELITLDQFFEYTNPDIGDPLTALVYDLSKVSAFFTRRKRRLQSLVEARARIAESIREIDQDLWEYHINKRADVRYRLNKLENQYITYIEKNTDLMKGVYHV